MSIDPAIFRALVEQGATPEMLLAVVEAAAAVDEARKEKKRAGNAERQARFRAKNNASNDSNALHGVTERDERDPPNDIYSNPPVPPSAKADCPPVSEKVVEAWNDLAARHPALSQARALTPQRRKHLAARIKEHGEAAVFEAIANVGVSDWHSGRKGDWHADLGWVLKSPENFQKLLEITPAKPVHSAPKSANDDEVFRLFQLQQRGEISEDEFIRRRAEIQNRPRRPSTGRTGAQIGDLVGRIAQQSAH